MSIIDLHVHTTFSDGNLSLARVLRLASELGIEEISITDHDSIENLRNYRELESVYNLKIIPGIEIAVDVPGMHILGYGIRDFDVIDDYLDDWKSYNEKQNIRTIEILQRQGFDISVEVVKTFSISDALTYRDIVRCMVDKGYANDSLEVYEKYIGKGRVAYFPSHKPTIKEILKLINCSRGISVLAHPYTLPENTNFDDLIPMMRQYGLCGIESHTTRHTKKQKEFFDDIARKYSLIQTAGTDFHNSTTDVMGINVDDNFLNDFHQALEN